MDEIFHLIVRYETRLNTIKEMLTPVPLSWPYGEINEIDRENLKSEEKELVIIIAALKHYRKLLQERTATTETEDISGGEWIPDDELTFDPARPWWKCSKCGERTGIRTKYCPECGKRNRRSEE